MKLVARSLSLLSTLLVAAPLFADAPKSCPVPGDRAIELPGLPAGWVLACGATTARPVSANLRITPEKGDDWKLMITAMFPGSDVAKTMTDAKLKDMMQATADRALPQAVETSVNLEEIGAPAHGYLFSLTDKAPKPGEYKYMTQANLLVKDALLVVTLLHRTPTTPGNAALRAALKTARLTP